MERQLLTWSIPNMFTVWLMLIALFIAFTVGIQMFKGLKGGKGFGGGGDTVENESGY